MQITFRCNRNTITPAILKALKAASDPRPALEAAGLSIVSRTLRAFDEPGMRPLPWAALKASSIDAKVKAGKSDTLLKRDGVLCRSARITQLDASSVTVGTDRFYAKFHQLGTKFMPARPFFPFTPAGDLTPKARPAVLRAIVRKLGIQAWR
ncbi:MAG: phage virion morphogenesis protein [Verrucomicrobiae bacterium]